ncbi:hypothetical protein ACI799_07615 [Blastococcus sp. SYSU DS0753]
MRLRFWEPVPTPVYVTPMPFGGVRTELPARRLNLTHLARFGREMAVAVDAREDTFGFFRWGLVEDSTSVEIQVEPTQLAGMLSDERQQVYLRARGSERTKSLDDGMTITQTAELQLLLGDGLGQPATLTGNGVDNAAGLVALWESLGMSRRTYAWVYPALFVFAVTATLTPLAVLWARGDLTRWLVPAAVALLALTLAVVSPLIQERVRAHRQARAGLDIDYRLLQAVRTDRAVHRRNLQSGLLGALVGALVTAAGVWATLKAGGS